MLCFYLKMLEVVVQVLALYKAGNEQQKFCAHVETENCCQTRALRSNSGRQLVAMVH